MTSSYVIQPNDQLFINNKWYFDVLSVEGDSVKVRLKYNEAPSKKFYTYRTLKLPLNMFQESVKDQFIVRCKVHEPSLKLQIGGLINRLAIEPDMLQFSESLVKEDVAAAGAGGGMGAVVNPGMSGTPGQIGSMGSGDIASPVKYASTKRATGALPKSEFGLQIHSKSNMRHINKSAKKQKGTLIKKPVMSIAENNEIDVTNSDHDYKTKIYTFLDYPTDNELDLQMIGIIAEYRPEIIDTSAERLVQYFRDLYNTNKALIKNKCSEWFQNNILVLAQLEA